MADTPKDEAPRKPYRRVAKALDASKAKPGYDPTTPKGEKQPDPDKPFRMRFGSGLVLEVRPTGTKIWRYRYRWPRPDGVITERLFTIGEFGDGPGQLSMEAAGDKRRELRALIKQGINPEQNRLTTRATKVAESANTFRAVAEEWFSDNPEWSDKYRGQVRDGLDKDILPAIGDRPIRSVTSADVLAMVKARKATPTLAILLRQWTGAIFKYAVAHQRADTDPTFAVRNTIKRPAVKHHAPLELRELPTLVKALEGATGGRHVAIGTELLMLTFVRPNEMRMAEWTEFDLEAALWKIPAARMKMNDTHYVPLSEQAIALLCELKAITGHSKFLFPHQSDPRKPMSETAFNRLLQRLGYEGRFTPHGFRATASTALNGMGYRGEVIEKQLAHAERDRTRASYNQQGYWAERAAMMQRWSDIVYSAGTAKVIPMKREAITA